MRRASDVLHLAEMFEQLGYETPLSHIERPMKQMDDKYCVLLAVLSEEQRAWMLEVRVALGSMSNCETTVRPQLRAMVCDGCAPLSRNYSSRIARSVFVRSPSRRLQGQFTNQRCCTLSKP